MRKKYTLELLRLTFKRGVRVPGGASKLIKSYIQLYNPADFFTYQDTSGEATAVYEHAGMTLVSQAKKKQYLVAPGKTLETGSRREVLGMAYATRYGPDRILGAKLGEVMDPETGKRKSNMRLFLEELGWHLEETTGDRVYEWVNPNRTYYTYKITASDSDKYYYGVSHVKKANASIEDCLNDGYWGSGNGKSIGKFGNWKISHSGKMQKSILSRHRRRAEAYQEEEKIIGDLFKTDPNCLNSIRGGKLQPHVASSLVERECLIHGTSIHNGSLCLKCHSRKSYKTEFCLRHGESIFHGGKCKRCLSEEAKTMIHCPVHGLSKHQGKQCYRCMKKGESKICPIHGEAKFYGDVCMKCKNKKNVKTAECAIHGFTKHIGENCYTCIVGNSITDKNCPIHGLTKHRGNSCFKCSNKQAVISEKECPVHGLTKHQGTRCSKCSRGAVELKECSIHGLVKHRGNSCFKCNAAKRLK